MQAAIVTGVSRGLGEAIAAALLARGFDVIGIGRTASPVLSSPQFHFIACDLGRPIEIPTVVLPTFAALAALSPASVTLINNAAVAFPVGRVGTLRNDEAQAAIAVNAGAPLALCEVFLRTFTDRAMPRRIINISSGAAHSPIAGSAVYCLSKAALEMLTRAIAADHDDPNFRCITLRPGIFETDMQAYMRSHDPAHFPSVSLFHGFKDNGLLKAPREVAAAIVDRMVLAPVEHGRTYSHHDLVTSTLE